MKRTLMRRGLMLLSALAVGATPLVTATPAHASLPAGQTAVAVAGSDTSEQVMDDIVADFETRMHESSSLPDFIPGMANVHTYNVLASPAKYNAAPGQKVTVPGDSECPTAQNSATASDQDWVKDPLAPATTTSPTKGIAPFGSSAGAKYLVGEENGTVSGQPSTEKGCIDVGRSSSAPSSISANSSSRTANQHFYAYALDAVSWATTSLKAPATLTKAQLAGIYDCTITDWGALPGGTSGQIQRYMPQLGSGTRSFFVSDILGKTETSSSPYVPPNGIAGCPDFKYIEENQANGNDAQHTGGVIDADRDKAILPYSAAVWSYHAKNSLNPTIDRRNGAMLHGINTQNSGGTIVLNGSPIRWSSSDHYYRLDDTASGPVKESNVKFAVTANGGTFDAVNNFPGIRFIYNILDTNLGTNGYNAALALYGFVDTNAGTAAPLCDARAGGTGETEQAILLSQGFAALPTQAVGTNFNHPGSTCRHYTNPA